MMNVSIALSYLCNFRCHFCYLTHAQLSNLKRIDSKKLDKMLNEISRYCSISHIDLYGGEAGLLPEEYLLEFHNISKRYCPNNVNVISNLSYIHPYFLRDDVDLSVSWDYDSRQEYKKVYANILSIPKDISVLMLASPKLMTRDVSTLINYMNAASNIRSVEIKPYSSNQANQLNSKFSNFEEFIKKWLLSPIKKNFEFVNEKNIKDSLKGVKNAWSDDHIYITPSGKFAVLEFDEYDNEYFKEYDTFDDYRRWSEEEKKKVFKNSYCNSCEFYGHCLSEHLRNVTDMTYSCNGFKKLLEWTKDHDTTSL